MSLVAMMNSWGRGGLYPKHRAVHVSSYVPGFGKASFNPVGNSYLAFCFVLKFSSNVTK